MIVKNRYIKLLIILLSLIFVFMSITTAIAAEDVEHINHCHFDNCDKCSFINFAIYFIHSIAICIDVIYIISDWAIIICIARLIQRKIEKNTLVDFKVIMNE